MKRGTGEDPLGSGPADDPFADDDSSEEESSGTAAESADANDAGAADRPETQSRQLPYVYSRDSVKEGRTQRPIFLRPEYEEGLGDLVDEMEDRFGETVYKTDVQEAAMAVAMANPDLLEATLEEWGYGWE
jgi:hypothetical protein